MTINSVTIADGDAFEGKVDGLKGCIYSNDALHGTPMVTSIAYHAGDTGSHILDDELKRFQSASFQECESAGHARTCCYGAAAKGR